MQQPGTAHMLFCFVKLRNKKTSTMSKHCTEMICWYCESKVQDAVLLGSGLMSFFGSRMQDVCHPNVCGMLDANAGCSAVTLAEAALSAANHTDPEYKILFRLIYV